MEVQHHLVGGIIYLCKWKLFKKDIVTTTFYLVLCPLNEQKVLSGHAFEVAKKQSERIQITFCPSCYGF